MKRIALGFLLALTLFWVPTRSWAGTWVVNFTPASDQNATAGQCWGTASATWTPTGGGDASGIVNPFTVTFPGVIDAKNATMQQQFLGYCKAQFTLQQQQAAGTVNSSLATLLTNGANALNASAQH